MRRPSRKLISLKKDETSQTPSPIKKKGLPPGRTLESVENQLVGLAAELAKRQLEEGTASSQVITHFLKLGSSQARLETEKLRNENLLLAAKTDALKSQKNTESLYLEAISAMRRYSGSPPSFEEGTVVEDDST
jgi:hypothetical protein